MSNFKSYNNNMNGAWSSNEGSLSDWCSWMSSAYPLIFCHLSSYFTALLRWSKWTKFLRNSIFKGNLKLKFIYQLKDIKNEYFKHCRKLDPSHLLNEIGLEQLKKLESTRHQVDMGAKLGGRNHEMEEWVNGTEADE